MSDVATQPVTFMSIPCDALRIAFSLGSSKGSFERAGKTLSDLEVISDGDLVTWLQNPDQRGVVRTIIESSFKGVEILKMECDESFTWELRLKVGDYMQKVYHRYQVHFVPNPKKYFDDLDELKNDEKEINENSQEEMPFEQQETEKEKKLNNIRKQRDQVLARLSDQRRDFPEISFEGTVIESKWPDDGTVLRMKIPASIVNILNEHRMFLKGEEAYIVRLEKIGD